MEVSAGAHPPPGVAMSESTIAICTRERPEHLRRCLERLAAGVAPDEEVLIIDNAPATDRTERLVAEFRSLLPNIRHVVETRPGLSRARNTALDEACGEIVIFIDDDTIPEPGWTLPLRIAMSLDPKIAIATGLVPPAELETAGQQLFESRLHWSEDLSPQVYNYVQRGSLGPLFPFAAGRLGTGANMAVRKKTILEMGGFDENLGAGTWSRGGEDLEMFVRALRRGWSLAYIPESVVWHVHPRRFEDVRKHIFGYGSGVTAYLTAVLAQPRRRELAASVGHGVRYAISQRRSSASVHSAEKAFLAPEVLGFAWGPIAYLTSRWRTSSVAPER